MSNPRFYCENCGVQVPLRAKSCPQCGRSFASVRCPSCDFTGEEGFFTKGCPVCGYSTPGVPDSPPQEKPPPRVFAGALPVWVYVLTTLALLGVGALLLIRFL